MTNMKSETPRPYRQTARAEAAAQTGRDVLDAAVALWREVGVDGFTLADVADRAGVTVQTVLRRFGSKDGLVGAGIEHDAAGIVESRNRAPAGDVAGALDVLLAHYESDGDAVLQTLAVEDRIDIAAWIVARGRAHHRDWCARVFGPYLPAPEADGHGARLDAFVAATDVYVWKLLRRDLGRSASETRATMLALLAALADGGDAPSSPHP